MTPTSAEPVVQVAPYFPPHIGGLENVAQTIAERLAPDRPVEVITSSSGASMMPRVERRGNLTIRRLVTFEIANVPFMPTLFFHLLRVPRRALVHVHIAQAYPPEVVWLTSLLRRRPYVAHFHLDVAPSGPFGVVFLAYKRWVLGVVLRSAARVIVLSDQQAEFVERRYGVRAAAIAVVPNGVGAAFAEASVSRPPHSGAFRLLFVGRLAPQKNVPLLLEAVARVTHPVELAIVGDGGEREMLEQRVADLHLTTVRMVGAQAGEDLVEWYRWADAFVIASEREGMPLVVLEAMAAGLPVIGTDVPGLADTIRADGILALPTPDALAGAIDRLIANPSLQSRLARRSRERGAQHSWTAVIERLQCVYVAAAG
jgi:glycosyltransferase involved in cell wall biosynthesis